MCVYVYCDAINNADIFVATSMVTRAQLVQQCTCQSMFLELQLLTVDSEVG
jgi:hypothetical protein